MIAFYPVFLLAAAVTGIPLGEVKVDEPLTRAACEQMIADPDVREHIAEFANQTLGPGFSKVIAGKCMEVEDQ